MFEQVMPPAAGHLLDGIREVAVLGLQLGQVIFAAVLRVDVKGEESSRRAGRDADIGVGMLAIRQRHRDCRETTRSPGFVRGARTVGQVTGLASARNANFYCLWITTEKLEWSIGSACPMP